MKSYKENWLVAELRSDHAGETGAVAIYDGIIKASRDSDLISFALDHRERGKVHLGWIEGVVPVLGRSRLLIAWKVAGFVTGFLPALFGCNAVYATIDAVETFVERHYSSQIDRLAADGDQEELRWLLVRCRDDEIEHRDQARNHQSGSSGYLLTGWCWLVGKGSAAAVELARKL